MLAVGRKCCSFISLDILSFKCFVVAGVFFFLLLLNSLSMPCLNAEFHFTNGFSLPVFFLLIRFAMFFFSSCFFFRILSSSLIRNLCERFVRGRKDYFVQTYKFSLVREQFHNQNRRITAKSTKNTDTEKSIYARNENGSMWNE